MTAPHDVVEFFDCDNTLLDDAPCLRSRRHRHGILLGAYPNGGFGNAATPAPTGGGGALEHLIAMLPPEQVIQVLRAEAIQGTLGPTRFRMPEQDRDGLRALMLYALCGAR